MEGRHVAFRSGWTTVIGTRVAGIVMVATLAAAGGTAAQSAAPGSPAADDPASVVAAATAAQTTWLGPTSAPAPVTGKTVGIIPCAMFIEGCARSARGAEEAARVLGWEPIIVDGEANPQSIQEAMDSLINRKVDAILLSSVNYQDIGQQVQAAIDAGIPVMGIFASDPAEIGGLGEVGIDDLAAGRALAAYALTNGGGGAVVFTQNESPAVAERAEGFKQGYEAWGADGDSIVAEQSVSNSQLGAPQEAIMSGILQQHPAGDIGWVYAGFDFMLTPLVNVIDREGRSEIKGFAFDGNLENLQFIRDGKVQAATVGYPLEWAGWAAIDQLNRQFNGEPLVEDTGVRFKLLTAENLPVEGESYTGDLDFRSQYKSLWGK
jgi:ribose transport system substrate-binding protein